LWPEMSEALLGAEITAIAAASTVGISSLDRCMAVFRRKCLQVCFGFIVLIEPVGEIKAKKAP